MPHADVSHWMRGNAKSMRRGMTPAEKRIWGALRAHRLEGLAFRRQFPIGSYIVDFACPERRLIVELDGVHHAEAHMAEPDGNRDRHLKQAGWTIARFWNDDVMRDLDGVCAHILAVLQERDGS
jgi:very-short-patch-repair endonuclease